MLPAYQKNQNNIFISFKKLWNEILEVANYVSHNHVKSQFEIFGILSYTKMTKCDFFFWRFDITIPRFPLLSFLYRLRYKIFWTEILHDCRIHHSLPLEYLLIFLKLVNKFFGFFNALRAVEPRSQKYPLYKLYIQYTTWAVVCCSRSACRVGRICKLHEWNYFTYSTKKRLKKKTI
jgi:hypothetical protein